MLEAIRKGASSWLVKVIVILPLILAFAIWGIEDMLRGYSQGAIATVGGHEITSEEFQDSYRLELDAMSRRMGRRLTTQQAQLFRIPDSVLSRMIGSATVDQHATNLGLALAVNDVIRDVQKDPSFHDSSGNFNRQALDTLLRRAGLSEERFLDERRRDALRSIITSPLLESAVVSDAMLKILHAYNNEARKISYFTLGEDKAGDIKTPDESVLKTFYEQRKGDFKTPEYRKITILSILPADVRKTMTVTEADMKARLDENPTRFDTPEQRQIEQIPFPDRAAAEKARAEIEGGKDFLEVAKAAGVKDSDVKLGTLDKSQLIDGKIAEAAFTLEKDKVSAVIEGEFSIVLLRVLDIKEGKKQAFDDVKDRLRTELVNERIGEEVQALVTKVDNLRLDGKTPAEIAKELKLDFKEIDAVDNTGKGADGKQVVTGPNARALLQSAFDGAVGVENEAVELRGGGYGWVDVLDVTPDKQRTLENAKADVETAWKAAERAKKLREVATKLVDRIKTGETATAVAEPLSAKVETSGDVKRSGSITGLPSSAIAQAFRLGKGDATSIVASDGKSRVVIVLDSITPAKPMTDQEKTQLTNTLRAQRRNDVLAQYLAALRTEIDVSINTAVLNQTLGITPQ
ncbi:MAG: SurA N-terminal domain-containing protein [Pseudomonadota bacterium]